MSAEGLIVLMLASHATYEGQHHVSTLSRRIATHDLEVAWHIVLDYKVAGATAEGE